MSIIKTRGVKEAPLSYSAVVIKYGGLDLRRSAVILTDGAMLGTARLIQSESAEFVKRIEIINLDETNRVDKIFSLTQDDLLILHIGIESWTGRHKNFARAFGKPEDVAAKYICIRPTITPKALLEGLGTPYDVTENILRKFGGLPEGERIRAISEAGTDVTLTTYDPFPIPFETREPGSNAYLPPAEISYCVESGSANGVIAADVTVGELRVNADLIDPFGFVSEPVKIFVEDGFIADISGDETAARLKAELFKLPQSCRKVIELGFGLSRMTPCGIIGIDESAAGTCHFGFGSGSGNEAPVHLDVVVSNFEIK